MAGWKTKAFALHWSTHFKLLKQPDQQYPPVLSEFIFSLWPDVAIQATTMVFHTDPDEEEPDQQITYWNMLEDVNFQLVQPDLLHTMDLGVQALRASSSASRHIHPDQLPVGLPVGLQGLAPELAQCVDWDVVVMPMCVDWDAPPPLVDIGSNDQSSSSSNMVIVEQIGEDGGYAEVVEIGDDEHSESSAETVGTYQDPELMGPNSEWCVIARSYI